MRGDVLYVRPKMGNESSAPVANAVPDEADAAQLRLREIQRMDSAVRKKLRGGSNCNSECPFKLSGRV